MRRRPRTTPRYAAARRMFMIRGRALKSKRQRPKRTRRRLRAAIVPLLVVPVVVLAAYGALVLVKCLHRGPAYVVKDIRVEGAVLFTPTEILDKARLEPGRPILDYSIHGARLALVADPLIRAATVVRCLPNTLVVRVVEREPVARLRCGGKDFLVDRDGYLFDLTQDAPLETLPRITGVRLKDPKPGELVEDEKLSTALLILKLYGVSSMPSLMQVESVDVTNPSNAKLYPKPGPKTGRGDEFMLGDAKFEKGLARLSVMLATTDRPLGRVDLRQPTRVPSATN